MTDAPAKSPRNKTLRLHPSEVEDLEKRIVSIENLTGCGFHDDMVVNGDLMKCLDLIPDEYFDLILLDPPYNLNKDFHGNQFRSMKSSEYETYLRSWFGRVCDKLKPTGTLYMCGDWRSSASMQRVIEERLTILNRISWQREKGRGAKHNWKNGMEDIWFAVKSPEDYYFDVESVKQKRKVLAPYRTNGNPKDWEETEEGNYRLTYPSNFWDDITIPFWSMPENTDHPTQKSEKLYAKLILASSKHGDKIFDPFLGSGSSAVAAKKLGRHYFGVEINREYCLWSAKRLLLSDDDRSIQGYVDGVFWERNTLSDQRRKSRPSNETEISQSLFGDI